MSAIKWEASKKAALHSRDVDSATGNEWIYDEVKDGHKDKNQQRIEHLDNRERKARLSMTL